MNACADVGWLASWMTWRDAPTSSKEAFHSLNSSTYSYLYPNIFNRLILQETTHHTTQIDSMGLTLVELLNGGDSHLEYREDKAYSHELIITNPYQHFSWDEENYVANVY